MECRNKVDQTFFDITLSLEELSFISAALDFLINQEEESVFHEEHVKLYRELEEKCWNYGR